jgi:hypothetical protein
VADDSKSTATDTSVPSVPENSGTEPRQEAGHTPAELVETAKKGVRGSALLGLFDDPRAGLQRIGGVVTAYLVREWDETRWKLDRLEAENKTLRDDLAEQRENNTWLQARLDLLGPLAVIGNFLTALGLGAWGLGVGYLGVTVAIAGLGVTLYPYFVRRKNLPAENKRRRGPR